MTRLRSMNLRALVLRGDQTLAHVRCQRAAPAPPERRLGAEGISWSKHSVAAAMRLPASRSPKSWQAAVIRSVRNAQSDAASGAEVIFRVSVARLRRPA